MSAASSPTESKMAYGRYPQRERRTNQPQPLSERSYSEPDNYRNYSGQPASRTRFYRDKENGKVMGVCAGIADYTGFDVALVRICFLAALFLSGGGVLPFYFIAGWVAPKKPRELDYRGAEDRQFWQGVRASPTSKATSQRKTARSPVRSSSCVRWTCMGERQWILTWSRFSAS